MKFCWHDWSKWSAPIDTAHGYEKVQSRYCVKCNKSEVAKIKQPWNIWFLADKIRDTK
jgi:hypothetical protein